MTGSPGSGKTTLALSAVLACGYRLLADGHLIVYRTAVGLAATSLPVPVEVPADTYLDYADALGAPWQGDTAGIEKGRHPRPERYASTGPPTVMRD